MNKTIVVTGFEPMYRFWEINPSWEAVKELPDEIEGVRIEKRRIPLAFRRAEEALEEILRELKPQALICVGQSGADNALIMEKLGVNMDDCDVPDNDEEFRSGTKIRTDGADAYFTTMPAEKMRDAVQKAGIPAGISYYAGGHLCNHVTYYGRYLGETLYPGLISGFIHVPLDMSQVADASKRDRSGSYFFAKEVTAKGLEAAIGAVAGSLPENNG